MEKRKHQCYLIGSARMDACKGEESDKWVTFMIQSKASVGDDIRYDDDNVQGLVWSSLMVSLVQMMGLGVVVGCVLKEVS